MQFHHCSFARVGTSPTGGRRLVYKFSLYVSCDKKVLAGSAGFLCSLLASHLAGCFTWETVAVSEWICFQISHANFFLPVADAELAAVRGGSREEFGNP